MAILLYGTRFSFYSIQPVITVLLRVLVIASSTFSGLFCVPRSAFFRGQLCFCQQTHVDSGSENSYPNCCQKPIDSKHAFQCEAH